MSNPSPKIDQLALGRGRRPLLGNESVSMRLSPGDRERLDAIAASYSCFYGGKGWLAGMLTKIGQGQLIIVPNAPYLDKTKEFADLQGKHDISEAENISMRLSPSDREILEGIAACYGCFYGGKPWLAGLLIKISNGQLIIVPSASYLEKSTITIDKSNPKDSVRKRIQVRNSRILSESE
jgi:hypothetical protein